MTKTKRFSQIFWLSFLFASLAYAWYSFYVPSNDIEWAEDMTEAELLAESSDKNIMLFFTGTWCVPCKVMKRQVFADKQVASAVNSKIIPLMIDVDDPKSKEIVDRYKAGVTPITLFIDGNGDVLDYAVGKIEKSAFMEMLNDIDG
ncbi:MAG: thioredoxin family protein [Saprospiraceae bacterium]|nr:thioredoxin family protein [Saprospiraceae bacterium]